MKFAGTATLAKTGLDAPDSSTPVLVMMAPLASRKVTDQPAGRPAVIAASVAADRSNESATALPLDTSSGTLSVAPGLTASVSSGEASGPAPVPVAPGT